MLTLRDDDDLPVSNRPETVIGVVVTFLVLSTIAVSLRLFVRIKERLWGWDDVFVGLAAAGCAAGSVVTCFMPEHGLGKHFYTLDGPSMIGYFKYVWASNVCYCLSTTFIKISILAQYLRLFEGRSERGRKITIATIVFVSLWGVTFGFLAVLSCVPVAKNWNFTLEGHCVGWGSKNANEFVATFIGHASSNMVLDIFILSLPVPFIRRLRMGGKTRMGLITLFILGSITVSLSIARVISLSIRRIGTVPIFDPSWATPTVYIFSVLELNMAILTASIPIFWPLVTSLAANKILIVNEIEIRTERVEENIALAHQGKGFAGIGEEEVPDGRRSRISVFGKSDADKVRRSNSRHSRSIHAPKHSDSSSKDLGINLGHRSSHDSQRKLNLAHQSSERSFSSDY